MYIRANDANKFQLPLDLCGIVAINHLLGWVAGDELFDLHTYIRKRPVRVWEVGIVGGVHECKSYSVADHRIAPVLNNIRVDGHA
jgi:hypothetical protein